jgi:hypothetical protein
MHSVIVGCAGPPKGECARRCVGSTCPSEKNSERILLHKKWRKKKKK